MHVRVDFLGCGCTIRTSARLAKVAFGYSYRLAHSLRRAEKTPIAERKRYEAVRAASFPSGLGKPAAAGAIQTGAEIKKIAITATAWILDLIPTTPSCGEDPVPPVFRNLRERASGFVMRSPERHALRIVQASSAAIENRPTGTPARPEVSDYLISPPSMPAY